MSEIASGALNSSVLVLNRQYMAVHVVDVRRAFALLIRELAEVIHIEDGQYSNYDFESWRAETDVLPPDRPGPRRPVRVLPAAILAAGGAVGMLGMVLTSRPLLAVAFALVLMSLALWIWLPLAELARSRREDELADRHR